MAGEINCENSHIPPMERLKSIFTKDTDGNIAIRTMAVTGCEEDAISCDSIEDFWSLMAQSIGTNECGKPALRLATPE